MIKSKVKLGLSAVLLGGATMIASLPASAAPTPKLAFGGDDTGLMAWQGAGDSGGRLDSPKDANISRLAVHVLRQDGDDYAYALPLKSGLENKVVGDVRNLSFDFENQTGEIAVHLGAGSPRYSIEFDTDGDASTVEVYGYLTAAACEAVLPENTKWSRADFTGRTQAGCTFNTSQAEYFTSDGAKSAWAQLVTAHPTWVVVQGYFILDEEGTAYVDRLAFQNRMYNAGGSVPCSSEAAC